MTDPRIMSALEQAVERGELGVQVAAYCKDELIIDAYIGTTGRGGDEPVTGETLFPVFSVTKAVTATALHLQAERGLVSYDSPVSKYWPEFGVNGKESVRVRDVLMHRAGIPQMPEGVSAKQACDWDWMISKLAALKPMFQPGTTNAYHSINWGWLVGEIVRRTDPQHRPFGQLVREDLCEPLDIEDLYIGLPPSERHRVATLISDSVAAPILNEVQRAAMPPAVAPTAENYNRSDIQASCNPGAGGIMTARAGARLFALLANRGVLAGVRLLSEERLLSLTQPRDDPYAVDQTSGSVRWIGVGGYWLGGLGPPANPLVGRGLHILLHGGAGGSIGWADLDTGLAAVITHNRMFPSENMPMDVHPFGPLVEAVRAVAMS